MFARHISKLIRAGAKEFSFKNTAARMSTAAAPSWRAKMSKLVTQTFSTRASRASIETVAPGIREELPTVYDMSVHGLMSRSNIVGAAKKFVKDIKKPSAPLPLGRFGLDAKTTAAKDKHDFYDHSI